MATFALGVLKRFGDFGRVLVESGEGLVIQGANQFSGDGLREDVGPDLGLLRRTGGEHIFS